MAQFSYIAVDGSEKTVEAPDANTAMTSAADIAPHSGVQAISGNVPVSNAMGATPSTSTDIPKTPAATNTNPTPTPEDQKLIALGVTPDQLKALSNPNGLDPTSFSSLVGNIESKLKTNNDLVTVRGSLIKHLYDSPLTSDELSKLPQDIQDVIKTGNKDAVELQLRLLNDQIAGRANTLSQSIGYITGGYKDAITQHAQQRQEAIANIQNFVSQYGSHAPAALKALYGQSYIDQLKAEGIDIEAFSKFSGSTINEGRYGPDVTSTAGGGVNAAIQAIVGNESGGNYAAVGQANSKGQRAYGKYQVMDFNIPSWTKEFVGRSMTPQEFLADQAAQDAVAQGRIGQYWDKYGNIADVASMWFTGKPAAESAGLKDVNGTTAQQYIAKATDTYNKLATANVDPTVQAYVDGIKSGTITSIAQVPAKYKSSVAIAMANQGTQSPLGDSRYVKVANGIIQNYISLPAYTLVANALPYMLKIDAAKEIPGSVADQELLDSFTKLSTSGGVITDAQVSVITGGRSLADTENVLQKKLQEGGVLSDAQRQQIYDLAAASYANLKKGYQPIYDQATKQLQASGVPEALWTLPDLNALSALSEAAVKGTSTSGASGDYAAYLKAIGA